MPRSRVQSCLEFHTRRSTAMTITEAIHVVAAHFNHVERFNHQSFFSIATCNTQLALSLSSITLSNSEQQGYYTAIYPRHINFSKYIKCFTLLSLSGKLAVFILATLVSLHCNIHKNIENLAPFKISYLNQRKLVLVNTFCVQGIYSITAGKYQLL